MSVNVIYLNIWNIPTSSGTDSWYFKDVNAGGKLSVSMTWIFNNIKSNSSPS